MCLICYREFTFYLPSIPGNNNQIPFFMEGSNSGLSIDSFESEFGKLQY